MVDPLAVSPLARAALASRAGGWIVGVAIALASLVVGGGAALAAASLVVGIAAASLVLAALVAAVVLVITPRRAAQELARLAALPYAFALAAYVASLGHEGAWQRLVVTVAFASAPPAEVRGELERAARRAGIEELRWIDDRRVTLASETYTTRSEAANSGTLVCDNGAIHRCLRRLIAGPLAAAHRASAIASIDARCE